MRSPGRGEVLETFAALNREGIRYVVLRGFLPLEELTNSLDIDLFIPRHDLPRAIGILQACGWRRRRVQVGRFPHLFVDSWEGPGAALVRSMDIVTDLVFGEELRLLGRATAVLQASELHHGVRVPVPWVAGFLFALHVLLDKRGVSAANAARARRLHESCRSREDSKEALQSVFTSHAVVLTERFFSRVVVEERIDVDDLIEEAGRLRALRRRRLLSWGSRVQRRLRQLLRPVARIAVIGIDGSGKSTLIEACRRKSGTVRIGTGYLGANSFRTWPTRRMRSWLDASERSGRARSIAHRVISNLYALWWPFEVLARIAIAEHRSECVLYDRFPFGQDDRPPTTIPGRLMRAYQRAGRRLIPRPDLVVFLDGDDRTLWERKREFPFEVHQATQARYRALIASLDCETVSIRTDRSIDESFADLRRALAASPAIQRKLYGADAGPR